MLHSFPASSMLLTGFAQVPQGTTLYEAYKIIGVVMVVDLESSRIIDVSFTFVSELTNRFLIHLIKDYDLKQGLEPLLALIRRRCKMISAGAVIQAIKSCYDRYLDAVRAQQSPGN